jgi:hypothetical protein
MNLGTFGNKVDKVFLSFSSCIPQTQEPRPALIAATGAILPFRVFLQNRIGGPPHFPFTTVVLAFAYWKQTKMGFDLSVRPAGGEPTHWAQSAARVSLLSPKKKELVTGTNSSEALKDEISIWYGAEGGT